MDILAIKAILLHIYRNRIRAAVNVLGDCFGAGIVAHYSKKDLTNEDTNNDKPPECIPMNENK